MVGVHRWVANQSSWCIVLQTRPRFEIVTDIIYLGTRQSFHTFNIFYGLGAGNYPRLARGWTDVRTTGAGNNFIIICINIAGGAWWIGRLWINGAGAGGHGKLG